jgi:hypothetical protein
MLDFDRVLTPPLFLAVTWLVTSMLLVEPVDAEARELLGALISPLSLSARATTDTYVIGDGVPLRAGGYSLLLACGVGSHLKLYSSVEHARDDGPLSGESFPVHSSLSRQDAGVQVSVLGRRQHRLAPYFDLGVSSVSIETPVDLVGHAGYRISEDATVRMTGRSFGVGCEFLLRPKWSLDLDWRKTSGRTNRFDVRGYYPDVFDHEKAVIEHVTLGITWYPGAREHAVAPTPAAGGLRQ